MLSRAFLASSFWVSARYFLLAASGILLTLGFARLAPKEVLGQYQFVLSLLSLFSIFSLPGLNMAALRAVSEKKPRAVITAVHRSFRTSLVAVPILVAYGIYLLSNGDKALGATVIAASLIFPFFYAPNTWYAYFEGRSDFKPVAIRTVIASFAVTAAVLVGLWLDFSVFWLVATFLLLSSAFSLIFYFQVQRIVLAQKLKSGQDLDESYGRRVTAQKFVYTLSESLPPLAVSFFLGHAALAGFQIASIFLSGVSGLIGALAVISLPRFFTEAKSRHQNIFWQNVVIGLLASIGYYVVVRLIFTPMYGISYEESYVLAQALVILPLVVSLRTFLVNYFTARDENKLIIAVYITANLLALAVFALLVRESSFVQASASYLYTLNLLLTLPLLTRYGLTAFRKTASS